MEIVVAFFLSRVERNKKISIFLQYTVYLSNNIYPLKIPSVEKKHSARIRRNSAQS